MNADTPITTGADAGLVEALREFIRREIETLDAGIAGEQLGGNTFHENSYKHEKVAFTVTLNKLNELAALSSGGGWMPIETAPRDGTPVIVANGSVRGEARYLDDHGWWWANMDPTDPYDGGVINPTKWMHMPPQPSADREVGRG